MKRFLRDNVFVLIGIGLPVFLVIFFALVNHLPKKWVSNPKFDFLYLTMPYPHDGLSTEVANGKIRLIISPSVRKGKLPMPKLFRFDAKARTSKEIPLTLALIPKSINGTKNELLEIPEVENLTVDPAETAQDGYKVEYSSSDINSLVFMINNSYKRSLTLQKNNNRLNIVEESNNPYGDKYIKFIGWIIPK